MIPEWASEYIERQVAAYLARDGSFNDGDLKHVAAALQAMPVYGDLGGVLFVAADGEVYCRCNNTMKVRPETNAGWRRLAWAAAADLAPELGRLLPARPVRVPDCPSCGGGGRVQVTPSCQAWCGACWGLGWDSLDEAGGSPVFGAVAGGGLRSEP